MKNQSESIRAVLAGRGLNNLTARKPYLSLCYVKTEGKLVTQPFVAVQVANIISYSALTHGSIKASGWRDTIRVVEEKEVTKVSMGSWLTHREVFEVSDYKFPEFTELKEVVTEVFLEPRLLLIWVSRRTFQPVQSIFPDYAWSPPLSDGEANQTT